ncbi:hypothetical protein FRC10_005697, partial [Ceratobasidium sp. 414]
MPVEELEKLLQSKTDRQIRSKAFLRAQCNIYLDPEEVPGEKTKVTGLQDILKAAFRGGQTARPELLALERDANQQFMSMIDKIKQIITNSRYIPVPVHPVESLEPTLHAYMSPPKKKHKRKNRSGGSRDLGPVTQGLHSTALGASQPVSGPSVVLAVAEDLPGSSDATTPTLTQSLKPPSTVMGVGQPMLADNLPSVPPAGDATSATEHLP